jgi:hypothetical protein
MIVPSMHAHDRRRRRVRFSVLRRRATADSSDTSRPEAHFCPAASRRGSPIEDLFMTTDYEGRIIATARHSEHATADGRDA